jgi:hypothetical protein
MTVTGSMGDRERQGLSDPHFPLSGKPGLNEDPNNPLEYSELFITPDLPK